MMMASSSSSPRLSYAHLFSFQVAYSNHMDSRGYANQGTFGFLGFATSLAKKKGEWNRAILEFDFVMETIFLQDKDRIVVSNTFPNYRRTVRSGGDSDDDTLLSIRFESEQWEIMVQNVEEKRALLHLLECIGRNATPEDVCELGKRKGIFGVDKFVMKHGMVLRKAKTAYKKDERYLVVVPGKLLMFMTSDIVGKHVRYVTTLVGARVQISRKSLELEILVPNTKDFVFSTPTSMEDFSHWVKVIEASARGEKMVYSDDSDGYYDNNDQYSNRGGGRNPPERLRIAGGNNGNYRSRVDDPYYHDERMGGDQRMPRYVDDDRRQQGRMPMRDEMDGQYNTGRTRQQPQQRGNYEQNRSNDYGQSQLADSDQFFRRNGGGMGMSKGGGSGSDQGDNDSWEQQKMKNANMRRRSVPLQCLDSALDDMAASIGNMQLYGGQQGGKNIGRMMPQQPNMQTSQLESMDGRDEYGGNYMNRPGVSKPIVQPMGRDDKYKDVPNSSSYNNASSSYAPKRSVYARSDTNSFGAVMGGPSSSQFPPGANKPSLPSGQGNMGLILEQPLPPLPQPEIRRPSNRFEKNVAPIANARMSNVSFNAEDSYEDQKRGDFPNDMYAGQGYAG